MVWCRELIMAINRALFNMIDPKTGQLVEDRTQRERILRRYFERDFMVGDADAKNLSYKDVDLVKIEHELDAFFSWNDYNSKKRLVLFDLKSLSNSFDSLFLYTNINTPNSILACKVIFKTRTRDYEMFPIVIELNSKELSHELDQEGEYQCQDARDILSIYGQAVPPYIEDLKHQGLKTMNLNNLQNELLDFGYNYILIVIPVLKKSEIEYQLILKLDWYKQDERYQTLRKAPVTSHKIIWTENDPASFRRYYLESFRGVWQAFDLVNKAKFQLKIPNSKLKPLSVSNFFVQFHEPVSVEQTSNRIEHVWEI